MTSNTPDWPMLRLSAALLLAGQLLYVVVTLFHTGGDANHHPSIFAAYASSGIWTDQNSALCLTPMETR